jgi:PAS domain S-box-containing protein
MMPIKTEAHNLFSRRDVVSYIPLLIYLIIALMILAASYYAFNHFGYEIERKKLRDLSEMADLQFWTLLFELMLAVLGAMLIYARNRGVFVNNQLLDSHQTTLQNIKRLKHLYAALSRVNEAIMRIGNREELLNEICRIAIEHGQFKLAWIGLVNDIDRTVEVVAASGEALAYLDNFQVNIDAGRPEGQGLAGLAIRDNLACISNDFLNDPRMLPWQEKAGRHGLRAAATCPLELEGRVVGVLTLYSDEKDYFDLTMTRLLSDFSTDISLALNLFARKDRRFLFEKKLHESEGKFKTLVDNLPQMIFVKDVTSVYVACNSLYAKSLGIAPEEIVGKTDYDFYPEALANKYRAYDKAILTGGRAESFEESRLLNGKEAIVHAAKATFKDEQGRVLGVLGVLTDITEQKKYEEIRAQMERDGRLNLAKEMASGLAHELSQPLAAVSNYLVSCQRRMAESGEWDREKLRKAVELALAQSERAGGIISHIKGLVKNQGHEHGWLNINQLVESTLVFLEDEVSRNDIAVQLALSPLSPVMACKVEIVQVLLNLYKNAIEAMRSCPVRVLTVETEMTDTGEVAVTVSDTGRGIPSDKMDSVFNPFYTSKSDGLGLGLAICRSFVDNHGGRIRVESGAKSGAVFCFTLPLQGRSSR